MCDVHGNALSEGEGSESGIIMVELCALTAISANCLPLKGRENVNM